MLCSLVCLVAGVAFVAGAPPTRPASARVTAYRLDVSIRPATSGIDGRARVVVRGVPPRGDIRFFLHGELKVTAVRAGQVELPFEERPAFYRYDYSLIANEVTVRTGAAGTLQELDIAYEGPLHPSRARSPSDYMRIDADGAFLRSYGYSLWFPVFLADGEDAHVVSVDEAVVRTPDEMRAVLVGEKIDETVDGAQRISRWRATSVDLRDVQLTVSRFEVADHGSLHLYFLPGASRGAHAIASFTSALVAAYRQHYRSDVSAESAYVIEMPDFGDISSGNVTGIQRSLWDSFESNENCRRGLAHELVHPYVRLDVDRADPAYALVVEGFPSSLHLPVLEEVAGREANERFLRWLEKSYLRQSRTLRDMRGHRLPTAKPLMEVRADEIGVYKDGHVMDRAVLFFDYLYRQMGRTRFYAFTRKLFSLEKTSARSFEDLCVAYLPNKAREIHAWLWTLEFPASFEIADLRRGDPGRILARSGSVPPLPQR